MTEWNENRLDQELDEMMLDMPEAEDLEMRIIKTMNQRIRKIVVCTVAVIMALLLAAFLVISPLMNLVFFNPEKLNQNTEMNMYQIMRKYVETNMPYKDVYGLTVESRGFGRYEVGMQILDLKGDLVVRTSPNVWYEINWGSSENIKDSEGNFVQHAGRFACTWENQEEMIEKIKELPESTKIYLSVSDTQVKTLEEVKHLPAELAWIQIYQTNAEFQGGMNMRNSVVLDENVVKMRIELTEEELLEEYISNLETLLAHEKVWAEFGLCDGTDTYISFSDKERTVEKLEATYEDATTLDSVMVENYCVYGKRDAIVQFLEENILDSINVEQVNLW